MSRDKIEMFYLHLHNTCKYQTWHSVYLGCGAPTYQVTWPLGNGVTWQNKSIKLWRVMNQVEKLHAPSVMWPRNVTRQNKTYHLFDETSWYPSGLGWGTPT